MQLDLLTTVLVTAGLIVAISLAVLAGKLSARVFFDASSRRHDEDEVKLPEVPYADPAGD